MPTIWELIKTGWCFTGVEKKGVCMLNHRRLIQTLICSSVKHTFAWRKCRALVALKIFFFFVPDVEEMLMFAFWIMLLQEVPEMVGVGMLGREYWGLVGDIRWGDTCAEAARWMWGEEGTIIIYRLAACAWQARQIIICSTKAKAVRCMYLELLKTLVLIELEDAECDGWDGISCSPRESTWLSSGRNDALMGAAWAVLDRGAAAWDVVSNQPKVPRRSLFSHSEWFTGGAADLAVLHTLIYAVPSISWALWQ